jgi:2-polyprenyl-3-methyl-5-hydroxy-6-metoxy-1,4-benzoquinol methylase
LARKNNLFRGSIMIVDARNKPVLSEDISKGSFAIYPETADIKTASEAYANRFTGKVGAWFLRVQEEAILRILRSYPKAKILDIGGGHGQMTGPLIRENYIVTVLGSAEKCNARIRDFIEGGHCNFQTGNILDLPIQMGILTSW